MVVSTRRAILARNDGGAVETVDTLGPPNPVTPVCSVRPVQPAEVIVISQMKLEQINVNNLKTYQELLRGPYRTVGPVCPLDT